MSIRISIYDFFAYTIPGGIVSAIVLYVTQKYQMLPLDVSNLSALELLGIGILAYLIGFVIDPIAKSAWYRFFYPKNLHHITLNDFNTRHPDIEIPFQKMDWYVSFAFIKRYSVEMAQELEHLKVINIMLRNSSFGVLIFGIVFALEFAAHKFFLIYAAASILCLLIAIVLVKQAVKYHQWFYEGIFQSLVALMSEPKQIPGTAKKKTRTITTLQRKDESP